MTSLSPTLIEANKPNHTFLQGKISSYKYGVLNIHLPSDPTNPTLPTNLTLLKAIDSVKDGASIQVAAEVFDIASPQLTRLENTNKCKSLPADILTHFQTKFNAGLIRRISYTRRKGTDVNPFHDEEKITYNFSIPDCGPTYSKVGKAPVIKAPDGVTDVKFLYSIGNSMDSGPSNIKTINLKSAEKYTIDNDTFKALGYDIQQMKVDVDNIMTINLNGTPSTTYDIKEFKKNAQGNKTKNGRLEDTTVGLDVKRMLLYFKSLGDTMIAWYWIWACLSNITQNIALLTCDTVLALQADIFSQGITNAYWLLNYSAHGEKHISYVFVKDAVTNYQDLFKKEAKRIIKRYGIEIEHFEVMKNTNVGIDIGNGKNIKDSILNIEEFFIDPIIKRLNEEKKKVESMQYSHPESYILLKSYDLLSLIKNINRSEISYMLIRSRFQFSRADKKFLDPIHRYKLNLEAIIAQLIRSERITRGGRNRFDSEEENFLEPQIAEENSDNEAISQLEKVIVDTLNDLDIKTTDPMKNLVREYIIKEITIFDEVGSFFDMLTYDFYAFTDYSKQHIANLCSEIYESIVQSVGVIISMDDQIVQSVGVIIPMDDQKKSYVRSSVSIIKKNKVKKHGAPFSQPKLAYIKSAKASRAAQIKKARFNSSGTYFPFYGSKGGRKTRRLCKRITSKKNKRSARKTQRRRN